MITKGACAAAMLAASVSVFAQQLSPPDNTDLKSAYCIGVEQQVVANAEAMQNSLPASAVKYAQEASRDAHDRLRHLQQYLMPRLPYIDPIGVAAARQRGTDDYAFLFNDPQTAACSTRCMQQSQTKDQLQQCTVACAPERLPRIWQCSNLSWLPF